MPQKIASQKTILNSTRNYKCLLSCGKASKGKRKTGEVVCYQSNGEGGNHEKEKK